MKRGEVSKPDARAIVKWAFSRRDLSWVHRKDYAWVVEILHPAVRRLAERPKGKRELALASDAYCLLGDIYDVFFDAPRRALRLYRASLKLDPEDGYAWAETGTMLHRLGFYRAAKRAWLRAQEIDPEDESVRIDLTYADRDIAEAEPPLHQADDPVCEASELIARGRPRAALRKLVRKTSVVARKCRARALEALEDHEGALHEWIQIGRGRGLVEFDFADWFFLSDEVWNSPAFWEAMLLIGPRLGYGTSPQDDSHPVVLNTRRKGVSEDRTLASIRRRWRLSARLHLARTRHDVKDLRRLVSRYPSWITASQTLREIEGK